MNSWQWVQVSAAVLVGGLVAPVLAQTLPPQPAPAQPVTPPADQRPGGLVPGTADLAPPRAAGHRRPRPAGPPRPPA